MSFYMINLKNQLLLNSQINFSTFVSYFKRYEKGTALFFVGNSCEFFNQLFLLQFRKYRT